MLGQLAELPDWDGLCGVPDEPDEGLVGVVGVVVPVWAQATAAPPPVNAPTSARPARACFARVVKPCSFLLKVKRGCADQGKRRL
jgi:hypothetical protein